MDTEVHEVDTSQRRTVDLTEQVRTFCARHGHGRSNGLCNVFVPHATAGVAIIETGAGSDADLVDTLERLLPRDDRYRHAHGSPGHGADLGAPPACGGVLPALVSPSVTLPVAAGEPLLGMPPQAGGTPRQSVVLVDRNRDNPRGTVRLSFVGAAT